MIIIKPYPVHNDLLIPTVEFDPAQSVQSDIEILHFPTILCFPLRQHFNSPIWVQVMQHSCLLPHTDPKHLQVSVLTATDEAAFVLCLPESEGEPV